MLLLLLLLLMGAPAAALHGGAGGPRTCADAHGPVVSKFCVKPGVCTPPAAAKYSAVAVGPSPSLQWDMSGGFCGAFSVQQSALAVGAYISQDLVRKANIDQPGPHHMHGNPNPLNCSADPLGCGWEVMPSNVKYTADNLRLTSDEFDYSQPSPQVDTTGSSGGGSGMQGVCVLGGRRGGAGMELPGRRQLSW